MEFGDVGAITGLFVFSLNRHIFTTLILLNRKYDMLLEEVRIRIN